MAYQGRFINLDRSLDRRTSMEAQLRKWALYEKYELFAEMEGGEAGCFRSHCLALEQAMTTGTAVHVLEDDVILSGYVPQVLETIVASGSLDQFDIVFTEMVIGPDVMDIREHKQLFDKSRADETFMVRDVTSSYWGGTTSYAVGPKNVRRVVATLKQGLGSGTPTAIDLFIKRAAAAGKLKLGCVFPFVTTIPLEDATMIEDRMSNARLSRSAFDL